MVQDALGYGEHTLDFYRLLAWVIMPNHVHIVIEHPAPLAKITRAIKGYTAYEANRILGRRSQPFWQVESYDHWIRNDRELLKIIASVEANPVSAGYVE